MCVRVCVCVCASILTPLSFYLAVAPMSWVYGGSVVALTALLRPTMAPFVEEHRTDDGDGAKL